MTKRRTPRPDDDDPPMTRIPAPAAADALTHEGRVVRLMLDKGYGFIQGTDHHQYFFHRSDADGFDDMTEGILVAFVTVAAAKGPRAARVVRKGGI
jgi:cold shock CspA family protein